ncbi:MAG: (2Fe-2S) ferredoxin domain-containing protein [Ignavibacteriales bacterium]|nr:(2Fe-2S) ferredoxin domain-containing protein [Ignavibacteriales bacterium]
MGKMTIADLERIRDEARYKTAIRLGTARVRMIVHTGTCGIAAGARGIMKAVMVEIEDRHLHDVIVTNSGCAGDCAQEPMMTVEIQGEPMAVKYVSLTPDKVKRVFDSHVLKGQVVKEYVLVRRSEKTHS